MSNKKYEFTGETKEWCGHTLHRIRAIVDIAYAKAGEVGGWIESESNLSEDGDAWVCGNAWVCGDAEVCGDAKVYGNAEVCGNAWVCGDARVCGDAAKLREALKRAWLFVSATRESFAFVHEGRIERDKLCDDIDAALSAPSRNCDRFATVDEARKAHEAICEKYGKCHNGCPLNNEEHYSAFDCFEAWLFAPATEKEGGNDGDK